MVQASPIGLLDPLTHSTHITYKNKVSRGNSLADSRRSFTTMTETMIMGIPIFYNNFSHVCILILKLLLMAWVGLVQCCVIFLKSGSVNTKLLSNDKKITDNEFRYSDDELTTRARREMRTARAQPAVDEDLLLLEPTRPGIFGSRGLLSKDFWGQELAGEHLPPSTHPRRDKYKDEKMMKKFLKHTQDSGLIIPLYTLTKNDLTIKDLIPFPAPLVDVLVAWQTEPQAW